MYWRLAITAGPKSRIPFGNVGFSIGLQYHFFGQDLQVLDYPAVDFIGFFNGFVLLVCTGVVNLRNPDHFCALKIRIAMGVTRLKRKNRKDKSLSAVRRQSLKIQNFQPVMKSVDVEQIKEEFKAKAAKKA